jgi:S-adenosylhomocysteine hydrolase
MRLADFGRKEIEIGEHEMPGLMATLRCILAEGGSRWRRTVAEMKGVSEETTTGVHRLYPSDPDAKEGLRSVGS